jgi:hypothetical protein
MADGNNTNAILSVFRSIAPVLGGALGSVVLPGVGTAGGAAIGSAAVDFLASKLGVEGRSSDAVVQAVAALPATTVQQLEYEFKQHCLANDLAFAQFDAQAVDAVNKTLQTEAMGGSFWQKNHHAYETSAFVLFIAGVYFLLPLLKVPVPVIPEFAYMAIGAALGITAWQRGAANVATAKNNGIH